MLKVKDNTDLVQVRPAFGGNIIAQIICTKTRPQMATVRYKIFKKPEKELPHGEVIYMSTTEINKKLWGYCNDKNGLGFNASAKASVATGIETYGINILGWKIEGGFSARILSVGNGLTLGSTPSGGWGISLDGPPGLYGIGCLIRITPP